MNKNIKKYYLSFSFIFILTLIFLNPLINSEVLIGNESYWINKNYGPNESLELKINLSLNQEPSNSVVSALGKDLFLKEVLDRNNIFYTCNQESLDCNTVFKTSGSSFSSKTIELSANQETYIGLYIEESNEISKINYFSFNVSSNSPSSCEPPLIIDVGNDNYLDWQSNSPDYSSFCSVNNYGCYQESDKKGTDEILESSQKEYCQKIIISSGAGILIGADIIGSGDAEFILRIPEYGEECIANAISSSSNSQQISCIINQSLLGTQEITVCLSAKSQKDDSKYSISYEDNAPCGYIDSYKHDFSIFAKPLKYIGQESFEISTYAIESYFGSNLEDSIFYYIGENYNYNCNNGCIVPIRIKSNSQQSILLSNIQLDYESGGIKNKLTKLNILSEEPALLNMNYTIIDFKSLGFNSPLKYGNFSLDLKINSESLVKETLSVLKKPEINYIFPTQVPAEVETRFYLTIKNPDNSTEFFWDFGSGDILTTDTNWIPYKFNDTGEKFIIVTAKNKLGNSSEKFKINVIAPKEYLNKTLKEYQQRLTTINSKLTGLDSWIRDYINKKINVNTLETELNALKSQFNSALDDEDFISIAINLEQLDIPSNISVSESLKIPFLIEKSKINLDYLTEINAGEVLENQDSYKDSIFAWAREYTNAVLDKKDINFIYDSNKELIASIIKLSLSKKEDKEVGEVFFVISIPDEEIVFKSDYSKIPIESGKAGGFYLSDLDTTKEFEFITSQNIDILNLPIYYSPIFSELLVDTSFGDCNYNGLCEKSLNENWKNCRKDCKPWGLVIIWIIVLLIIFLIIYILLQEWYKKHYESHLFKSKDDLYNLIHFIDNAIHQKLTKDQIQTKLKSFGWSNEQIIYAYKKYNGERTGMWEIPLFKVFEKRRINQEIQKRNQNQVNIQNKGGSVNRNINK